MKRNLLLASILCLGVFTHLSGQNIVPDVVGKKIIGIEPGFLTIIKNDTFPHNWTNNDQGVKYFKKLLAETTPQDNDAIKDLKQNLAVQYMFAGNYDSTIKMENEFLAQIDPKDPSKRNDLIGMYSLLGVSWQRKGEVENCRTNHNAASCILPFQKAAFHTVEEGSKKAIEYYTKSLEIDPKLYANRWLLNICYMTLGEYPAGVPKEYFVDLDKYDAKTGLEKFEDIAPLAGVNSTGWLGGNDVEDFNNDGNLDLFSTSYRLGDHVHLYINNGKGGFDDKTKEAGLEHVTGGSYCTHVDYNNDGFNDIFIVRGGWLKDAGQWPYSLLRNNGNGTFTDVTVKAGINGMHPSQTAAWADVNNDGWPDLFVGNERWDDSVSQPSLLYINQRNGTFKEMSAEAGIKVDAYVKGVVFGDINNDGLPDLYISTFGSNNLLYLNTGVDANGNVHFKEIGKTAGVQEPKYSFPCAFLDINNDGWEDLVVIGYEIEDAELASEYMNDAAAKHPPKVYLNNHDNTFTDVTEKMGLNRSIYAMGLNYGDIDNDGYLDIYAATGNGDFRSIWPNLMLKNVNGEKFVDVTAETATGHLQKGHSVSFGDINNDGAQDIFLDLGGFLSDDKFGNVLFLNHNNKNNWIGLKLSGAKLSKSALGARIKLVFETADGVQKEVDRTVSTGASYGANAFEQILGMGPSKKIISLTVTWPVSGLKQEIKDLEVNHYYSLIEGGKPVVVQKKVINFSAEGNMPMSMPMHHH